MKNIFYTIILFCFTIFVLSWLLGEPTKLENENLQENVNQSQTEYQIEDLEVPSEYMQGVFVATVYNLDFPSKATLSNVEIADEIDEIILNSKNEGITDIFLQVRPSADAFYESEIFPPSIYATGSQDTELPFDILDYAIEKAHDEGLKLHAWINPYRITKTDSEELSQTSPAIMYPELTVLHSDGNLYFDPALPEVRELITLGVKEIIENYDVDGIHFDDYFYPGTDFNDSKSYEKYGEDMELDDFRRDNVTKLIQDVYDTIDEISPNVEFGISPFGIWANEKNMEGGSDTHGSESYSYLYADTKLWVEMGILDYIAPQIYWAMDFDIANYITLVDWWVDLTQDTDVTLYISQANYKEVEGSFATGEIQNQIDYNIEKGITGSIYFRYEHIMK